MIFVYIYISFMSHGEAVQPRKQFSAFPKQIGNWMGKEGRFSQQIYDVLGVDDSILISYINPEGQDVQLYVGYYQTQREGSLIHSPKNCMPDSSIEEVAVSGSKAEKIKVIKLVLEKGIQKQVVLYWYQSRGRFISSEYWQKIYLVWDAIFKNRTDGSFVRLITFSDAQGEISATNRLKLFASRLIPILNDYIPGETG
ncbi:MAG: EpsI family protein [Deltaproteobacteria bacterium]|nr:EpsI family protein [Deltaproteobacteria bacterium]